MDLGQLREDVALANRIVHRAGLVTALGHVSARIPNSNAFVFPTRASPALARPETLLVMDTDGRQLEGDGEPNTEFWIHARIYAARGDVGAVAHVHAPACVVLGQLGQPLQVLHNGGSIFGEGVPLFQRVGLIRTRELGDQVAATLGGHRAMLLRGHGANVAERDIRRATVVACLLEQAAALQLATVGAVAGGAGRVDADAFTPEQAERVSHETGSDEPINRAWQYYAALAQGHL